MPENLLEWTELLSYVVTIVGLPLAIYVFLIEQRKERQADEAWGGGGVAGAPAQRPARAAPAQKPAARNSAALAQPRFDHPQQDM